MTEIEIHRAMRNKWNYDYYHRNKPVRQKKRREYMRKYRARLKHAK